MKRVLFCGVDVGASATKLVLTDASGEARARHVRPSGVDYSATARECLAAAIAAAGAAEGDIARTVATGYGRGNVPFASATLTEIHCHALGAHHLVPGAITVVDIGGQDNKVIRLDDAGGRLDFRMNRKCAAGTGAFLEEIALRLAVPIETLDHLARSGTAPVHLSSFCTVFAKTEILTHLRRGAKVEDIVRGAFLSVVARVIEMAPLDGTVVLTGGVAAHNGVAALLLAQEIGREVIVPPFPQFTGALGAALGAASGQGQEQGQGR